MSNYSIFKEPY